MSAVCKTCHDPIVLAGETSSGLATWDHDGEPADHKVEPQPCCDKCGSPDFPHYDTNWGFGNKCGACGYDWYYSLGD